MSVSSFMKFGPMITIFLPTKLLSKSFFQCEASAIFSLCYVNCLLFVSSIDRKKLQKLVNWVTWRTLILKTCWVFLKPLALYMWLMARACLATAVCRTQHIEISSPEQVFPLSEGPFTPGGKFHINSHLDFGDLFTCFNLLLILGMFICQLIPFHFYCFLVLF